MSSSMQARSSSALVPTMQEEELVLKLQGTTFGNFSNALAQFKNAKDHNTIANNGLHGGGPTSVFHNSAIPQQFWVMKESTINPVLSHQQSSVTNRSGTKGVGSVSSIAGGGNTYLTGNAARAAAEQETGTPSTVYDAINGRFKELLFPSAAPTGRDEVLAVAKVMDTMMIDINVEPLVDGGGSPQGLAMLSKRVASIGNAPTQKKPAEAAPAKTGRKIQQHALRSIPNAKGTHNKQGGGSSNNKAAHKLMFENGASPVALDGHGNELDAATVHEEAFDHHKVRQTQQQLSHVLMIGWMEVIRQTYAQTAERGVLLEKIRCCFSDMLQNAYDIADYFQQKVDDIESLKLDERIHQLYKLIEKKDHEIRSLKHHVDELKDQIESFDDEKEELTRLKKREQYMNVFLNEQIERNAQLIQLGQVINENGGLMPGGGGSSAPRSVATRSRRGSIGSRSRRTYGGASQIDGSEGVGGAASSYAGSSFGEEDEEYEETDELDSTSLQSGASGRRGEPVVMVDAALQVDTEKRHDDVLYSEVTNMMRHLESVTSASDKLAHQVYGHPDVAKPSYHCALAIGRLEDLTHSVMAHAERTNIAHGNPNHAGAGVVPASAPDNVKEAAANGTPPSIPARGSLYISKPLMVNLARDASSALKQMYLRLNALLEHRGLQKALTDPLRPPKALSEPCQLCKRLGLDPKIMKAHTELEEATSELYKLRKTNKKLADEVVENKVQIEHFKNKAATLQTRMKQENLRRRSTLTAGSSPGSPGGEADENDTLDGQAVDSAVPYPDAVDVGTNTEITIPTALEDDEPPVAGSDEQPPTDVDENVQSGDASTSRVETARSPLSDGSGGESTYGDGPIPALRTQRGMSIMEQLKSPIHIRPSSPPLKLELVINCRCTEAGYPPRDSGAQNLAVSGDERSATRTPGANAKKLSLRDLATMVSTPTTPGRQSTSLLGDMMSPNAGSPLSTKKEQERAQREEKRRNELSTRVSKLRDVALLASSTPQAGKSLLWTLKLLASIYKSKHTSDIAHIADRRVPLSCPEHIVDYMKQTYGTRKLVDEQTMHLLKSLKKHEEDLRVQQFQMFLNEEFTRETYGIFVRLNKIVEDSIGMFDTVHSHTSDDEAKFSRIALECAVYSATQIFRDEPALLEKMISGAIELSAPAGREFRNMTVADFEVLDGVTLPDDRSERDVPRAHFLRHCCELLSAEEVAKAVAAQEELARQLSSANSLSALQTPSQSTLDRPASGSIRVTQSKVLAPRPPSSPGGLPPRSPPPARLLPPSTAQPAPSTSVAPPEGFLFNLRTSDHTSGIQAPGYVDHRSITPTAPASRSLGGSTIDQY